MKQSQNLDEYIQAYLNKGNKIKEINPGKSEEVRLHTQFVDESFDEKERFV